MNRTSIVLLGAVMAAAGSGWMIIRARPVANNLDQQPQQLLDLPPQPVLELAEPKVETNDWPCWRGPKRNNHSADLESVQSWGEHENIVWKAEIPGRGHSTPILIGKRIVLTSADEHSKRQFALCLDRGTGERLWETTIHENHFSPKHPDNSFSSGTPASDGERIFVVFPNHGAIHVTALDLNGTILWNREVGPHGGEGCHGSGTSLATGGSFIYVSDDSPARAWIAAIHRASGEIAWRKVRQTTIGSYGSPIVAELDGQSRLLLAGSGRVTAYDPKNGDIIWERGGLAEAVGNTVAFGDSMVFASSGYPQRKLLALRADGSVAWKKESGNEIPYPPSMVYCAGHLYAVSDQGLASCFDGQTGKQCWKERLQGSFYSSPLLVGKHIYACNRDGATTIFDANPDAFVQTATNKLDAGINANPVAVGGKLYIRTEHHLYCIGKK